MKHSQDAEDVVSETVIAAYENIKKIEKRRVFPQLDFYDIDESV